MGKTVKELEILDDMIEEGFITVPDGMTDEQKICLVSSLLNTAEKFSRWHQEESTDNKRTFKKPVLEDRELNGYKLQNFHIKEDDTYALFHGIDTGDHIRLMHNGEVVMSDTKMERMTNQEFLNAAHGKVLIGGLGIGLILLPLLEDDEITEITVVEYSQEVIDMVLPQLPKSEKLKVVQGNVFEYFPEHQYNTIYMDIWNSINSDVYWDEMVPLTEFYEDYLDETDKDAYIGCWASYEAENDLEI